MPEGAWPRRKRDVAATARGHRARRGHGGVVVWLRRLRRGAGGKARLGPRQRAAARLGLAARVRTHARGSWLPRAAVWPCRARGTGIPGPRHGAAARGRWRWRARRAARRVPAQERRQGRKGEGVLGVATEGSSASPAARDREGGDAVAALTGGLAGEGGDAVAGWCRWVGAVQGARLRRCRRTGAGSMKRLRRRRPPPPLRAARRRPPPRAAPPPLPPSSPLLVRRRRKWRTRGRLGFRGAAAGALIRGAGARARLRPGLFGVRAGTRGGITAPEGTARAGVARVGG
jgi:hypothetical protein